MNNIKTKFNVGQAMPDVKKGSPCRKDAPLSSSRYSPYGRMRDIRGAIKNFAAPIPRIETLRGDEALSSGFTLIELLVVVLIIGILAAVALPQYQRAVEKSRATQALTLVKSVLQAAEVYYLANGTYATSFDELAVDVPWQNSTEGIGSHLRSKSNGYWAINIDNSGAILALRLSGKYQGAFFDANVGNPVGCAERKKGGSRIFKAEPGSFCEKIMKGTLTDDNDWNREYSLP